MSSILSENTITKFEASKKILLRIAIWTMVSGVVLGAILILVGGSNSGEMIGKLMGTVLLLGLMLLISVNNFRRIASRDAVVQVLALIGLVTNVLWAILWVTMIWAPELLLTCDDSVPRASHGMVSARCYSSVLMKIALCVSYLSGLGFFGSNIMSMFEGEKRGVIRPLKITCLICILYEYIYAIVLTIMGFHTSEWSGRFGMLSGFVAFAWIIMVIVALVISSSEKRRLSVIKKNSENVSTNNSAPNNNALNSSINNSTNGITTKTESELRAEIEEKVRREMIEKEVREQFAREHNQNNQQ